MVYIQREFRLKARPRGFHLVTAEILQALPEIRSVETGQLQIFIKHTSASLTLNENADHTVRGDFERHFNKLVPENAPYYKHTLEGPDDMPAHIKASLLGATVQLPVTAGQPNLGTWQGVYLCEHRDAATGRWLVLTLSGV